MDDNTEPAAQDDKKPKHVEFGELINQINKDLAVAAVKKDQMAELGVLEAKAAAAADEYNPVKYAELVRRWSEQDRQIAELLTMWRARPGANNGVDQVQALYCAIEQMERRMADEPAPPAGSGGNGLYARRALLQLKRDASQRKCEAARRQVAAWEKPAQTLDKVLADNAKLIADADKSIAQDATTLAFDLYFRLAPVHLKIKPHNVTPAVTATESGAAAAYCLPGPLPSLIEPSRYRARYMREVEKLCTATNTLAEDSGALAEAEADIARTLRQIDEQRKNIEKNARAILSSSAANPRTSAAGARAGQP